MVVAAVVVVVAVAVQATADKTVVAPNNQPTDQVLVLHLDPQLHRPQVLGRVEKLHAAVQHLVALQEPWLVQPLQDVRQGDQAQKVLHPNQKLKHRLNQSLEPPLLLRLNLRKVLLAELLSAVQPDLMATGICQRPKLKRVVLVVASVEVVLRAVVILAREICLYRSLAQCTLQLIRISAEYLA
jgi:hypothetical protein